MRDFTLISGCFRLYLSSGHPYVCRYHFWLLSFVCCCYWLAFTRSTMWLFLLFLAVSSCHASPASLEVVNDDELVNLFRSEKYVVVLFSKCPKWQVRGSLWS